MAAGGRTASASAVAGCTPFGTGAPAVKRAVWVRCAMRDARVVGGAYPTARTTIEASRQ